MFFPRNTGVDPNKAQEVKLEFLIKFLLNDLNIDRYTQVFVRSDIILITNRPVIRALVFDLECISFSPI